LIPSKIAANIKLRMKVVENLSKETFLEKVFDYEKNKDWKYKGDVPCIIDFYADWCGPCKMVAPILDKLDGEFESKLKIYKVDTEVEQELAGTFGIRSIPSMLFVPMNDKPQMSVGALPKDDILETMKNILGVS
jgi:thioredoxin